MSIKFLVVKLKGEEHKAIIQAVQRQLQEAVLGAIKPLLTEFCEEEVTVKIKCHMALQGLLYPHALLQKNYIDWNHT